MDFPESKAIAPPTLDPALEATIDFSADLMFGQTSRCPLLYDSIREMFRNQSISDQFVCCGIAVVVLACPTLLCVRGLECGREGLLLALPTRESC